MSGMLDLGTPEPPCAGGTHCVGAVAELDGDLFSANAALETVGDIFMRWIRLTGE